MCKRISLIGVVGSIALVVALFAPSAALAVAAKGPGGAPSPAQGGQRRRAGVMTLVQITGEVREQGIAGKARGRPKHLPLSSKIYKRRPTKRPRLSQTRRCTKARPVQVRVA